MSECPTSSNLFSYLRNLKTGRFSLDGHKMLLQHFFFFFFKRNSSCHPYFPKYREFLSEIRLNEIYVTRIPDASETSVELLNDERTTSFWRTSSWCSSIYLSKNPSTTSIMIKTQKCEDQLQITISPSY